MRSHNFALTLALGVALASAAPAAEVALKDGRVIKTAKPYAVKGAMAILTLPDGRLLSVPASEVDVPRTQELSKKAAAAPPAAPAEPTVAAPKTLAEAAQSKGRKKASVVLTDSDVVPGEMLGQGEGGEKKTGGGDVTISGADARKVEGGYAITGSVMNSSKIEVSAVKVTIEAIGDENKTIATVFGQIAKDSLGPGEKAAFTAQITTDVVAKSFRYVPSWQETVPRVEKVAPGGGTEGKGDATAAAKPSPSPTPAAAAPAAPAKAPEPEPTPRYVPDPGMAPPQANAPVGAPTTPGGAYIPRPSDSQAQPQPPVPTRVP